MRIDGKLPIAGFAAELPGAIAVFESLGVDYACAGALSLDDAAHAAGIAPEVVLAGLRRLKPGQPMEPWNERPLSELTRHLAVRHHRFVREELAAIALKLADACTGPGVVPAYLVSLRTAFTRLSDLVLPHMRHEEEETFRLIETVEKAWQSSEPHSAANPDLHAALIRLTDEHGTITEQLRVMRELRVRLAESSAPALQRILEDLATLEAHLHEYMFLENCILFPRAAALAQQAGHETATRGA